MKPYIAILFVTLASCFPTARTTAGLPHALPESVGMRSDRLQQIKSIVQEGLDAGLMPGCVISIGRHGHIVYQEAYGYRQVKPLKVPMTVDTVFDMASITKPVATATSVMVLVEQGKLRLRDSVATYIPEFANGGKQRVTLTQLLTHQAGFIPDNPVSDYRGGRAEAFAQIYQLKTTYSPGSRFVYSDVGFILLGDLIERAGGKNVHEFSKEYIFEPLGMTETGYLPAEPIRARAAVTEQREGRWMCGEVHDPRAYLLQGVAGHAGLFSTAEDLAVYAQMMLNGGTYGGKRILAKPTVELMTRNVAITEGTKVSIRGLGWDKLSGYSSNRGENFSMSAFGHGGFTGTVLWIDPELDLFFIFLSNRVHPEGKGVVNRLAGRLATVAAGAIDDEITPPLSGQTQSGIDVLRAQEFASFRGQRVGLITNQTGIARDGTSTMQLLQASPHVDLRVLFSPEHGIAGNLEQSRIDDSTDPTTGVQIYSLYGESRSPTATQLEQIDTLVFDIQDIGCRFYTYVSTMGLAMRAAARHGKRFVVLDRPNPINGIDVAGPMLDPGRESFVAFHALPVRHGMTVGELAQMFNDELDLGLDLQVVPCHGWNRDMYQDQWGQWWVNPSPNMRNLNQALLYPGIGLWETTNISVGRGTDTPFELIGAPWIKAQQLATAMNKSGLRGVTFTPRKFIPTASKFQGQLCQGVQICIMDRSQLDPLAVGVALACAVRRLHAEQWQLTEAKRLLGNQRTLAAIESGQPPDEILASFRQDLRGFRVRRDRYLIYPAAAGS